MTLGVDITTTTTFLVTVMLATVYGNWVSRDIVFVCFVFGYSRLETPSWGMLVQICGEHAQLNSTHLGRHLAPRDSTRLSLHSSTRSRMHRWCYILSIALSSPNRRLQDSLIRHSPSLPLPYATNFARPKDYIYFWFQQQVYHYTLVILLPLLRISECSGLFSFLPISNFYIFVLDFFLECPLYMYSYIYLYLPRGALMYSARHACVGIAWRIINSRSIRE